MLLRLDQNSALVADLVAFVGFQMLQSSDPMVLEVAHKYRDVIHQILDVVEEVLHMDTGVHTQ